MVLFFFVCPSESLSELLLLSLELVLDRLLDVLELAFCCPLKVGKTLFGFSDALQFREATKRKVLLPPATKLRQGYVFTGVCDSVHGGGAGVAGGMCGRGVYVAVGGGHAEQWGCAWQGGMCGSGEGCP